MEPLIEARSLGKVFPMGGGPVHALRDITAGEPLLAPHGQFVLLAP